MLPQTHRRRAPLAALAVLLALTALSVPAAAQGPLDPAVQVQLDGGGEAARLDAGANEAFSGRVANEGRAGGSVRLEATAPEGWRVQIEPAGAFSVAAGSSAPFVVRVFAPDAEVGAAEGGVVVRATLTDAAGQTATGEATLAVARVDPPVPVPPTPWWQEAAPWAAGLVAFAVVAGAAAVAAQKRRRQREAAAAAERAMLERETGVTMRVEGQIATYGWQRELAYRLVLENVSDRPRVGLVRVASTPDGWRASVNLPRVPLSAGERVALTLHVQPPPTAEPGELVTFLLGCRPEEAREREQQVDLSVEAPPWRVPVQGRGEAEPQPRPRLRP